ncbi:MAG: GNAT family N-acetyltransferase [Oscillospiraceae bacterium]|nr:GNAT family N-acetyltransferase [Oscillospiraceae bacterium]
MEIKLYQTYVETEILDLYRAVGWSNYYDRPQMVAAAFAKSLCTVGAWEDGRLVGFLRAVGDGASILFIQDIVVHPDCQRRGIGTALMRAILERYPAVYQTELATDNTEKTVAFYRSLGFVPLEELGCRSFIIYR